MSANSSLKAYEKDLGDGLSSLHCIIDGIHCGACTQKIESHLNALKGVVTVRANATTKRLNLVWNRSQIDGNAIIQSIETLGFSAHPFTLDEDNKKETSLLIPLAVAGFGTMNIMVFSFAVWSGLITDMGEGTQQFMHWLSAFIAVPVCLYSAYPFYLPGFQALKAGRMTMDVPITLAIFITLFASLYETARNAPHVYYDAAVSLIFFLLIGRVLDQMLRRRSSDASDNLRAIGQGHTQRFLADGTLEHVLTEELVVGDKIFVPLGEYISADGILETDYAEIDESIISGETYPRRVRKGEPVIAGSIVLGPAAKIEVTAIGQNSRLSAMATLVDEATTYKGRAQTLADQFARGYGPFVISLSVLGFLFWHFILSVPLAEALLIAVAVLVVTCPCAAGLATPAVMVRAVNHLLQHGVLVKSGDALERLSEIDSVVIDKTGTLTNAKLELAEDHDVKILEKASEMAVHSPHPLAQALARVHPAAPLEGVREYVGQGLVAPDGSRLGSDAFTGQSIDQVTIQKRLAGAHLWFCRPGKSPYIFYFRDHEKPDAAHFIRALKKRSLDVVLLSGDKASVVRDLAKRVGLSNYQSQVSPEDKFSYIRTKQRQGFKTLMIGDGLNDAPSLALAYVSISPASAAEISQNAADMVLIRSDLLPILDALEVSKTARKLIKQNLLFATIYNIVTVPLALAGGLTPLMAAILMSSSSLLVMLNAQRLRVTK